MYRKSDAAGLKARKRHYRTEDCMEAEVVKLWAIAIVMGLGTVCPALAIAMIGKKGVDAIGRNPEAASKVQTAMILAIAFAEAIAIYALVVSLILKFV